MLQHSSQSEPGLEDIDCFACESGCVHFEYGSTMLSFSRETFMYVAELFAEARQDILDEEELLNDWSDRIEETEKI